MESVPVRRCSKCGIEKPETKEFFLWQARRQTLTAACRSCLNAGSMAWQRNNRSAQNEIAKRYRVKNHAELLEREREQRKQMPEKIAEKKARYRAKPETKAKEKEDRQRYYSLNRERLLENRRQWAKKNPDMERARLNRRRARILVATGIYTGADVQRQMRSQNGLCYWCQKPITKYHVDHIIALSKGGTNGPENICISCPNCNHTKGNRMPWEFTGRLL